MSDGPITKNKDTEKNRRFWAAVEEAAREVETWPAWKRGGRECPECDGSGRCYPAEWVVIDCPDCNGTGRRDA